MGMPRRWGRSAVVAGLAMAMVGTVVGSVGAVRGWRPPVDGEIVRPFAAPEGPYGAGHRGIDYAVAPGTVVHAPGAGTVTFAGDVGGTLHVVLTHRGGVRTSVSFLQSVDVRVGDMVGVGEPVGRSGGSDPDSGHGAGVVHFGVRLGERFVDPRLLFSSPDPADLVRLVPAGDPGADASPWSVAPPGGDDGGATSGTPGDLGVGPGPSGPPDPGCGPDVPVLGVVVAAVCTAVDWAASGVVDALHAGLSILAAGGRVAARLARHLAPLLERLARRAVRGGADAVLATPGGRVLHDVVEIGSRFLAWATTDCIESGSPSVVRAGRAVPPTPPSPPDDHRLMAVGGLDSSTGSDGRTFGLDVAALGYAGTDVRWYSYAADGGDYTADETEGSLRVAARHLAVQLRAMEVEQPGRPVDVIAHSQGGLVVDWFLTHQYERHTGRFPPVTTVVTLSSPHQGAPLAHSIDRFRSAPTTRRVLDALDATHSITHLPRSDSAAVRDLAEGSAFMRDLWAHPLPPHVAFTTVGGTDDVVVPADRIHVPGAREVVVAVAGAHDHSAIPRDPRALEVVRAALGGGPLPCTTWQEGLRSALEPVLISRVEDDLGPVLTTYLEVHAWG